MIPITASPVPQRTRYLRIPTLSTGSPPRFPVLYQALSLIVAALVLRAFGLLNAGRLRHTDVSYGLMNFVGAALLTWVAVVDRRAGFIILESTWALISLAPLFRTAPAPRQAGP